MATFSSSPAPRRSSRIHTRANSPSRTQRPHRLAATPTFIIESGSGASPMDVDDRASIMTDRSLSKAGGDVLFAKTEEMTVSFYANLPLEVKQVLRTSDFSREYYSGEIDTLTGFALVTSSQTCFVWQHAQAIKGIPTCYIFSSPSPTMKPPFHALVPQGGSREPGLILVSPSGSIRFWDSIGSGLAGGDNYSSSRVEELEEDEEVTNLVRADAQTYILSTSYGRLYRLGLSSAGGKYHLSIRKFAPPASSHSFSILTSFFLPSSSSSAFYDTKDKSKHVHAVSLGSYTPAGDRDVWALANGRIQQWCLKAEGWEELKQDHDLTSIIAERVIQILFGGSRTSCQDLELDDMAVFSDQNIAILLSYSVKEESEDFRRLYALAELEINGSNFILKNLKSVPYQTTNKPGLPVHPRIQLIYEGAIISVQFGDAVALCARDSEYRDRLELRSISDRTLGLGVSLSSSLLLALTATAMMKVSLDMEKIEAFKPETGHTSLIKSIMMQAILYGSSPLNPLKFSFPPELNEDALMQGAEQLSSAVLKSDPQVVRQSPDMTTQLTGRKERLSWLISFINENAVLYKMSQRSRQKLATDAEKLYSAHQLWLTYNQFLSTSHSESVLKDAVVAYMTDLSDNEHTDVVRSFFRSRVGDLGKLLKKVVDVVLAGVKFSGPQANNLLPEANRIVVTVLAAAFQYRAYNLGVYGIELPMISSWTSKPLLIDAVLSLFDLTTKAVEATPGGVQQAKGKEIYEQMPTLAGVLFEAINERLSWLTCARNEDHDRRDLDDLRQRFAVLRPEALETLRRCGHTAAAFALAEKYSDFASLVALCHRETVFPPERNPHAARIRAYVERYKEGFADELFAWYIQHAEARTLFAQEAWAGHLMDAFFARYPNIGVSWLHDLGKARYVATAAKLLDDSARTSNLEARHLMLSIGKLAYLTGMKDANAAAAEDEKLDAFHDGLNFVSVHEGLVEEFRAVLAGSRGRQSIDSQVEAIVKAKGRKLEGLTAFTYVFKDMLRNLLQGKTLSVEDVVDLLTLKDNEEGAEDYARSLELLDVATNIPQARQEAAVRTVWRRIWLHDDWASILHTADVSDEALNARYRGTAVFATLCALLLRDEDGAAAVFAPDEVLAVPGRAELASRWTGWTDEQLEALQADYNTEQDVLGEWDLGEVHERIVELAQAEVQRLWEQEG